MLFDFSSIMEKDRKCYKCYQITVYDLRQNSYCRSASGCDVFPHESSHEPNAVVSFLRMNFFRAWISYACYFLTFTRRHSRICVCSTRLILPFGKLPEWHKQHIICDVTPVYFFQYDESCRMTDPLCVRVSSDHLCTGLGLSVQQCSARTTQL